MRLTNVGTQGDREAMSPGVCADKMQSLEQCDQELHVEQQVFEEHQDTQNDTEGGTSRAFAARKHGARTGKDRQAIKVGSVWIRLWQVDVYFLIELQGVDSTALLLWSQSQQRRWHACHYQQSWRQVWAQQDTVAEMPH